MRFKTALLNELKRTLTIKGRTSRQDYWYLVLGYLIWVFVFTIASTSLPPEIKDYFMFVFIASLYVFMLSMWTAVIRRLHDQNKSIMWLFWLLIPILGSLILLFYMLSKGDDGPNQYGENPNAYDDPSQADLGVIAKSEQIASGLIFLLLLLGIFSTVALPAYQQYKEQAENAPSSANTHSKSSQSLSEELVEIAEEINKGLPKQIDDMTTMLEVRPVGDTMNYVYQVALSLDDIDVEYFRQTMNESLLPEYCRTRDEYFSGSNLSVDYAYYGSDDYHVATFSYVPSDCQ